MCRLSVVLVSLYAVLIVWVHVRNPSANMPLSQATILSSEVFLYHQTLGLGYVIILLFLDLASMAAMQQYTGIKAHKGRPEV